MTTERWITNEIILFIKRNWLNVQLAIADRNIEPNLITMPQLILIRHYINFSGDGSQTKR